MPLLPLVSSITHISPPTLWLSYTRLGDHGNLFSGLTVLGVLNVGEMRFLTDSAGETIPHDYNYSSTKLIISGKGVRYFAFTDLHQLQIACRSPLFCSNQPPACLNRRSTYKVQSGNRVGPTHHTSVDMREIPHCGGI